ncbi:MAG TPA: VWA domain-containing protein [Kofleriaceae bacterium]|jgi:uncharacterized membrane protein
MSFHHPLWLWLIAPAFALAVAELVRKRRVLPALGRLLLIAFLAGAAADPRWVQYHKDATVVFLIDRSASVTDEALAAEWDRADALRRSLGPDARAAVVQFDGSPDVALAPGDVWARPAQLRDAKSATRDATDIGAAMRLGLGLVPPGAGGHLVLLGDGRATTGDLASATRIAKERAVPVSVIPSGAVAGDPAIATVALDSDRVRTGATLTGHVDVDGGGVTGHGVVHVKVGGVEVAQQDVDLSAGRTNVPFTYSLPQSVTPGVVSVDATLDVPAASGNADPANDKGTARLSVERPPHILILDGDEGGGENLATALRADQMTVTVMPASGDGNPEKPLDLTETDLVIMANAPVRNDGGVVDDKTGERIVKWVNDGGGLVVLGGPSALDGAYAANRIADALPIELEPSTPELDGAATVIIVLDESGSMGEMVGGQSKLALACEGSAAVIRLLRSFDRIGVEAVEDRTHWTIPVRTVGEDKAALETKVRGIPIGGNGIFVYTGLKDAQEAMDKATTPLKHVILFSDTFDAAEQVKGIDYGSFVGWPASSPNSFTIARQMRDKGITLSVIGVGNGADGSWNAATYADDDDDTDFLKQLAVEGGGRYYRTTDATQLRGLFVQDARKLLDNRARDEDIHLISAVPLAALNGVDLPNAPALHGFQEVKPRAAAQVAVTTTDGKPILVRWPYGLGESMVWASDGGPRWAKEWLTWPGYARMWTQLARSALRRHEGDAAAIEADFAGDQATVRVVRRTEAANAAAPRARITQDGQTRELPLRTVAPGVYEAPVSVTTGHEPKVELVGDGDHVLAQRTLLRPASTELRERGPDKAALEMLARVTGGTVEPTTLGDAGKDVPSSTPLAAWLLLAAILMIPLDANIRRSLRA